MGLITMVASARDGVGKSTTCMFLADAIAAEGRRVLVIELDQGSRSLDILSGLHSGVSYDLLDLLEERCGIRQAVVPAAEPRTDVFVLPSSFRTGTLPGPQFQSLVRILSDRFDHILIDTACRGGITTAACRASAGALLIVNADPFSVRDARIANKRLLELGMTKTRLVINRLSPSRIGIVLPDLDSVIDHVGARLIGVIPESSEIAVSAATGVPLVRNTTEYEIYSRIIRRMEGDEVPLLIQ